MMQAKVTVFHPKTCRSQEFHLNYVVDMKDLDEQMQKLVGDLSYTAETYDAQEIPVLDVVHSFLGRDHKRRLHAA